MTLGRIDHRAAAMLVFAFTAPSLAVGFARMLPSGPASADASTGAASVEPPAVLPRADIASVVRTDKQRSMILAARLALEGEISESPFPSTEVLEHMDQAMDLVSFEAQPTRPALPDYRLSSILAGRNTIAVIDGVAYMSGADLGDGWSIGSIDADGQTVVIGHKVLGKHTLSLHRP